MQELKETLTEIVLKQKVLFVMMLLLFFASVGLFIFAVVAMNGSTTWIAGYGDLESYGYKFGTGLDAWAFPILAIVLGVVHNLLVVRVFREKGASWAKVLAVGSVFIVLGAIIVLSKLIGEG